MFISYVTAVLQNIFILCHFQYSSFICCGWVSKQNQLQNVVHAIKHDNDVLTTVAALSKCHKKTLQLLATCRTDANTECRTQERMQLSTVRWFWRRWQHFTPGSQYLCEKYTGWQWRSFVPYLCQLIFAAILQVKLGKMFRHCDSA